MQAGVPVWADSYIIHRLELKVVHNTILPAWGHGNGIVLDVTDRVTHCGQQPCHGPKLHRGEGGGGGFSQLGILPAASWLHGDDDRLLS